ncbi:hypothetical protein K402DRAFT_326395 [Aulographum hederae CBS 113979]|uniref:Uncharacterized protein n=1 Tax=Aulographum hederae CBS 113979 TaxID=1176131 RepID=A0A6G1H8U0_9PEZI|nr:hypothetical protein K402DRAFT_326395 [Aulographum hederae CBS 113979]
MAAFLALAATALAKPSQPDWTIPADERYTGVAVKVITSISPDSGSCDGANFADECATATQAAPHVLDSFNQYQLYYPGEQAAVLSTMLFESGGFKCNKNHFPEPGVPGQGTRNMQSPNFNKMYAEYLAQQGKLDTADVQAAEAKGAAEVLDLVMTDEFSFGSAAWFLSTQCDEGVRTGLQDGSQTSWEAYLTTCVGTTVTPERVAGWQKAIAAVSG